MSGRRLRAWALACRPWQWSKNLLLWVPLLLAHRIADGTAALQVAIATVGFSLCASSVYVINDIADCASDRLHPTKRRRPFAAGELSAIDGIAIAILLALLGLTLCATLDGEATVLLVAYMGATCLYTFVLKRIAIIDVLTLASFYVLRVYVGGVIAQTPVSPWLLTFSLCLFLSLALVKRCSDLLVTAPSRGTQTNATNDTHASTGVSTGTGTGTGTGSGTPPPAARKPSPSGYQPNDLAALSQLGIASGLLAVLVLGLYLNSPAVMKLYDNPDLLWTLLPLLIYGIARLWMLTLRGLVCEDPVVFALRDRSTGMLVLVGGAILYWAI